MISKKLDFNSTSLETKDAKFDADDIARLFNELMTNQKY